MLKKHNLKKITSFCLAGAFMLTLGTDAFAQRKKRNQKAEVASVTEKPIAPKKKEKTYESLVEGMKVDDGLFKVYQKDGKIMYEIPRTELGKDMLWVTRLVSAPENFGGGFVASGSKMIEQVVRWEERQGTVYLKKISFNNVADSTDAIYKSVANNNFAPIIGSFKVAGEPKDSSALLIDVSKFFTQDTRSKQDFP